MRELTQLVRTAQRRPGKKGSRGLQSVTGRPQQTSHALFFFLTHAQSHTGPRTYTLSCTAVSSLAPQSGGTPDFEHSEETGAAGQPAGRVSLRQ